MFFDELMFPLFFLNQFLTIRLRYNSFQHIGPWSRQLLWKMPLEISSPRIPAEQVRQHCVSSSFHGTTMPTGKPGWHGCSRAHFSSISSERELWYNLQHRVRGGNRAKCTTPTVLFLGVGLGRGDWELGLTSLLGGGLIKINYKN